MDTKKQALRQFLRKQARAQIPVTLYDIKLSEYVSAWKERDGFVKPSQVIQNQINNN
jgi:hypothetical protein